MTTASASIRKAGIFRMKIPAFRSICAAHPASGRPFGSGDARPAALRPETGNLATPPGAARHTVPGRGKTGFETGAPHRNAGQGDPSRRPRILYPAATGLRRRTSRRNLGKSGIRIPIAYLPTKNRTISGSTIHFKDEPKNTSSYGNDPVPIQKPNSGRRDHASPPRSCGTSAYPATLKPVPAAQYPETANRTNRIRQKTALSILCRPASPPAAPAARGGVHDPVPPRIRPSGKTSMPLRGKISASGSRYDIISRQIKTSPQCL